jgi:hypothetical protein
MVFSKFSEHKISVLKACANRWTGMGLAFFFFFFSIVFAFINLVVVSVVVTRQCVFAQKVVSITKFGALERRVFSTIGITHRIRQL